MLPRRSVLIPVVFLFLSGCVTMEVAREVQSGRRALNVGNPKGAVPHFEAAARLAPDYTATFSPLQTGIWTYVGRSYYEAGEREKALENLQRARKQYDDDYLAQLYLGLVMSESGSREIGKKEIEAGLRGLREWLETISARSMDGHYWDPGRSLRKTVVQTLGLVKAEDQWAQVAKNIRWLGKEFDEEPEKVRRDRRHDLESSSHNESRSD